MEEVRHYRRGICHQLREAVGTSFDYLLVGPVVAIADAQETVTRVASVQFLTACENHRGKVCP